MTAGIPASACGGNEFRYAREFSGVDPDYSPDTTGVFSLETALAARTNPGGLSIENLTADIVDGSLLGR